MIIFLIALLLIMLWKIKFSSFHETYISSSQTTAIKGIFAALIVLSHLRGYVSFSPSFTDAFYVTVLKQIGQLMVTLFFFYSGYGLMESYRKKPNYAVGFFKNRILKVMLHFDIALIFFAILNIFTKTQYSVFNYVCSIVGWTSIGNSNWFIFVTLVFYVITLVAMKISKKLHLNEGLFISMITVLCIAFYMVLFKVKLKEPHWYNTIFCFPAGFIYSMLKGKIECFVKKGINWYILIAVSTAVFLLCNSFKSQNWAIYTFGTAVFCFVVVLLTMKIKVDNPVLHFLGVHSFSIYIMQRLPMIILKRANIISSNVVFALVSICLVIPIAVGFTKLLNAFDKVVYKKR